MIALPLFYDNTEQANVRVHGNGFVQAELTDGSKIHIWTKDCPSQEEPTLIHNHTKPFISNVLYGVLINEEYKLVPSKFASKGDQIYRKYEAVARKKKDTVLEPTKEYVFLATSRAFHLAQGSTYEFPGTPELFHMTMPASDFVATRVMRASVQEPPVPYELNNTKDTRNPEVLVKDGNEPDNKFDRYEHTDYGIEQYNILYEKILGWNRAQHGVYS